MLPRIIAKIVGWAVSVFYDIARSGPMAPSGPVLIAANHPNALIDPVVIFLTAGRPTQPLAKAPLFEKAIMGTVLKGLGGLPVYRRQDDPAKMHLNHRTFDAVVEALHRGGAVQIYPEGLSHSESGLAPLRTGAARIALRAESEKGWQLGLKIQPVGLTYEGKHRFGGRAVASFGEPFDVSGFRSTFERDPKEAARSLTVLLQQRLERLMLSYEYPEDQELVDVAERLYARQKKLARPRERQAMVERLPRLRRFADGIRWLRATDPARLKRLQAAVRRYLTLLTLFGAREGDVPTRFRTGTVVLYASRQLLMLSVVMPVAALGVAVWALPYLFTRHAVPRFRPKLDQMATYKVGTALIAFPVWWTALCLGAFFTWGMRGAVAAAVGLPVAGLAAIAWRERQAAVREDARVFLRARRKSETRDRLREQRADLVAQFDTLTEAWLQDRRGRPRDSGRGGPGGGTLSGPRRVRGLRVHPSARK